MVLTIPITRQKQKHAKIDLYRPYELLPLMKKTIFENGEQIHHEILLLKLKSLVRSTCKTEVYPLSRTFKILVIHNFGQLKFQLPHLIDMA